MKKILILLLIVFLTGCFSKTEKNEGIKELVCSSTYTMKLSEEYEVEATTKVRFENGTMISYVNIFMLGLEGEDEKTIDNVFEDMKDYYSDPERQQPGVEQVFDKGEDFVSYVMVFDIAGVSEEDKESLGTFESVKEDIEERNYVCE